MKDRNRPSGNEIQSWYPTSFDEIVGNQSIVECFSNALRTNQDITNTLLNGDSRSGKTSAVKAFARCLLCTNRPTASATSCGRCKSCTSDLGRNGEEGLFAYLEDDGWKQSRPVHFIPMDCTHVNESQLRDLPIRLRDYHGTRIVYLDEIHRLKRRGLDELLLTPLEMPDVIWIASSAVLHGLEPMFINRFLNKLKTSLPERAELVMWLDERCHSWSISYDQPETLIRIADGSHCCPGLALHVLAKAACYPDRTITQKMVGDHSFHAEE